MKTTSRKRVCKKPTSPRKGTRSSPRLSKMMIENVEIKPQLKSAGGRRGRSAANKSPKMEELTSPIPQGQTKQNYSTTTNKFEPVNLRDNPYTSNINSGSFTIEDPEHLDSCMRQMLYEELSIDFYPSAIRAIENSDNQSNIHALHHVENIAPDYIKC